MYVDLIEIDFNSDEAIYMQLRNQIILGIATSRIHNGDTLPSVRQLADLIGINMHTVNKAYSVLKHAIIEVSILIPYISYTARHTGCEVAPRLNL